MGLLNLSKKDIGDALWNNRTHGERGAMIATLAAAIAFGAPAVACEVGVHAACVVGEKYMEAVAANSLGATIGKSFGAAFALFGAGKAVDAMTGNAPQHAGYTPLSPAPAAGGEAV